MFTTRSLGLACALITLSGLASTAARQEAKAPLDTLVMANRILAMEGLVGPYGHVSVREDAGHFWIADHRSPDTVERQHLRQVDIGLDQAKAEAEHWYREIFIHSEMYRMYPNVGAVVHVHPAHSTALGTLSGSDRVVPTTNPGSNLGAFIPIYHQTGLIETPEQAQKVAGTLQGQNGVLLRGHGAVLVGGRLEQAVLRAIYLEVEARTQLMARAAGTPLFYSPEESARFSKTTAIAHAWDYYVQRVQALRPSAGH